MVETDPRVEPVLQAAQEEMGNRAGMDLLDGTVKLDAPVLLVVLVAKVAMGLMVTMVTMDDKE